MKIFGQAKSFRFGIIAMLLLCFCTVMTSILTINVSNLILNSSKLAQGIEEFIADIDDCWYHYQSLEGNFSKSDLEHTTSRLVSSAARHNVASAHVQKISELSRSIDEANLGRIVPRMGRELTSLRKTEVELYRQVIEDWSMRASFFNWLIIGLQLLTLVLVGTAFFHHLKFLVERRKTIEASMELARLVETSHDAILSIDASGRIKRWNPASLKAFALSQRSLLNIDIQELAANMESRSRLEKMVSEGVFYGNEEVEFHREDSSSFIASVSASPVRDKHNELVSTTLVAKDVTEQVLLRREQADFIASLTHDLKNPLISNNQILKLIAQGDIEFEKQGPILSKVIQSNNEMIETFSSMLELYKINAGVFKSQPMPVDVSELVIRLIQNYSHQAETRGIDINVRFTSLREEYLIDPLLVQKIVGNLIDNAIKYSESNSNIHIEVEQNAEYLSFRVEDEGHGISQKQIDSLFSLKSVRRLEVKAGSSSIGLYLCFKLAKELGGEIVYLSANPRGSIFELRVPVNIVEMRRSTLESECSPTSA